MPDDTARPAGTDEALARLLAGNRRFAAHRARHPDRDGMRRAKLAQGQFPYAVVLGCSDSRVPLEIVFDQGLGDLFVVRVAGNTASDALVVGSIEYAVTQLGTRLLMVLGHEGCGAVASAVEVARNGTVLPGRLPEVVAPIIPGVELTPGASNEAVIAAAVRTNVRRAVGLLRAEPMLADLVAAGDLAIVGAEYHLATGEVGVIDPPS